jgi:ankyrin repeat protein
MLLEAKADPNVKNMIKASPLMGCAADGRTSDEESCGYAKLLLEAGADPDARDEDGKDAMENARIKGKSGLVKLIQGYKSPG